MWTACNWLAIRSSSGCSEDLCFIQTVSVMTSWDTVKFYIYIYIYIGKRPLGRQRRRWEDGIRMDLRDIGLGGVDWIRLAQDTDRWRAVVSAVMNLRVVAPRSYIKYESFTATECNAVFSRVQPCEHGVHIQLFGDCTLNVRVDMMSDMYIPGRDPEPPRLKAGD
jgi:hypothetical protein